MKFIIISDNHFCTKSSVINGRGERYSDRLENQIESIKWVDSFNLPVIHLGDFFDRPVLTAEEVSALEEIIPLMKGWIFLRGNHEYSGDYDVLGALGATYIRKPTDTIIGDNMGLKTLFLPFNSTEEDIKGDYDLILGHIGLKDIPFGAKGMDFGVIDKHCKIFLNGHLHNRYKLGENKWNMGSLTAQNFSDDCLEYRKGAVILDTDTGSLEFIENPYAFNFFKLSWDEYQRKYQGGPAAFAMGRKTSCISITCKEGQKNEIFSCNMFTRSYYLRVLEETKKKKEETQSSQTLESLDPFIKFRKSFIEKYGESTIINEELAEILKS